MNQPTAEMLQWESLSDEELRFCWQCLVDQGQLTADKLQKFMLEVTGDELTHIQAKDLLGYLDATGDGRVGMEEFRHFMSAGELDMMDPQTFLWSPTKSFRERLGLVRVAQEEQAPAAGKVEEPPHPWDGLFLEADDATEFSRSMDSNKERRNSLGKKGKAVRPPAVEEESPEMEEVEVVSESRASRTPGPTKKLDEKTLARIFMSVQKYEQQTWERLLSEQEATRKRLFAQWTQNANEMTSKEYHKMLSRMHKLSRSSMPGDLKPGDTLATMQYMLEVNSPGKDGEGKKPPNLDKRQSSRVDRDEELLLPFATWHRCMSGKFRPEVLGEQESQGKKEAKAKAKE